MIQLSNASCVFFKRIPNINRIDKLWVGILLDHLRASDVVQIEQFGGPWRFGVIFLPQGNTKHNLVSFFLIFSVGRSPHNGVEFIYNFIQIIAVQRQLQLLLMVILLVHLTKLEVQFGDCFCFWGYQALLVLWFFVFRLLVSRDTHKFVHLLLYLLLTNYN